MRRRSLRYNLRMSKNSRRPPRKSGPKPPNGGVGRQDDRLGHLAGDTRKSDTAFRIRLRGRDGAPLSMPEVRQGLLEAVRELKRYDAGHRAKWVTLYLTLIDDEGREVVPPEGDLTLLPYKSAAEEFGI